MKRLLCVLLCSSGLGGAGAPAIAQEAGSATTTNETETIIVQARRRDEDVQDVPAVIDTVTSEQIGKLNLRDFREVATIVPGLQLTTEANGVGGNARLRGVNFDVNASGNNPTVEFYFNDAPITAGVILQQLYDVGQIEVQRGPQGTLRGRAAPSGSITVGARKPNLYDFGGFVDMTANDIGTQNYKGALNIPLIEGIAAIRVAGVYDENEVDRVRPLNGARDPQSRTASGRISALLQPTDWLKLEGVYQRLDRRAYTYDQVASFSESNPAAPASPVYIDSDDRRAVQESARPIRQVYDIYNWRAEGSALGQVLIYQGQHYTQKVSSTANIDLANLFPGDVNQVTNSRPKSTSHEVRLQNQDRVAGFFDYVIGFFDNRNDAPTRLTSPTIVGLRTGATTGRIIQTVNSNIERQGESHERSFFGNLTAHLGTGTEISGGLRHIDYSSDGALLVNGAVIATDAQDAKKWIYAASVKHNFNRDLMVYASTGSSWRPGIVTVGDFSLRRSALQESFLNLPAETSKSYEIGVKSTLMGGRLRANVSGFHQKFKNYPFRTGGQGVYYVNYTQVAGLGVVPNVTQFNFVSAVPVEVNGIEGELSFDLMEGLSVNAVASYALGKIKGGNIPCNDLNGDGVPDTITSAPTLAQLQAAVGANNIAGCQVSQRAGFTPPFSATLSSEYQFGVSDRVNAYLRGLLNFNGNSRTDPGNPFDDTKNYGLVNLYTGIRDPEGAWEVALFAKNLFDTTRVLSQTNPQFTAYRNAAAGGAAATYTGTYVGITTTAPREFGINVRYAFGSR
ncbi:TonB-dependent receptor [Novosphingobium soli]|uniref:TonB-dependent receptor n=1 Tax=Novosphingobium soli TaxID=574956 RepID=A0ABV6CZI7_9SPHN